MGTIHHHAVVATTWSKEVFNGIQDWVDAGGENFFVSDDARTNGYRTLVLTPDGSKEGWDASNIGNILRDAFVARLEEDNYEDGSSPWDWVEVEFGELGQSIVRGNCQ